MPTAFFAEKPFVHVRIFPSFNAVCSTGKLKVIPRGRAALESGEESSSSKELPLAKGSAGASVGEGGRSVRNASTESAR